MQTAEPPLETTEPVPDKLAITKDRLKAWSACSDGYRWFLEHFPQGGQFAAVHAALNADKRYSDADWLLDRVFADLDTGERVRQTVLTSGADAAAIEKLAQAGGPDDAVTTGEGANAVTTGEGANAVTTGEGANAATTGEGANAATTGYMANAATTGEGANAATTGYRANAATTGYRANAATTGYMANAATTGEGAVAAALGVGARGKASAGGAIVLAHRDDDGRLLGVFSSMVGQNGIKPDVWYELDASGRPVKVAE